MGADERLLLQIYDIKSLIRILDIFLKYEGM